MTVAPEGSDNYAFGPFRLDVRLRALFRGDVRLPLTPKSFETLHVLVEQAGSSVDKDTLLARVWHDVAVEENSLAKAISEIRRALGEESRAPRFVATLPGHGYRFIAPVTHAGPAPALRRIAVMPFASLAAASDDDYLAVGLADALITRLSRLRQIIVRPTRAILRFARKDQEATAAGRQLGVDWVLDGTIQRGGDRIRVSAQLIDVSTGALRWAGSFDETFTEIFSLEDAISERVVTALALVLSGEERQAIKRQHTSHPEAYTWYLKGRFHLARRTAADCERAIESFQRVIAADPHDALAHSGVADAYVYLGVQALVMRGRPPVETFPRAKAAVKEAFAIDAHVAEAYTAHAQISFLYDWDAAAATDAHQRSLTLDPNNAAGHHAHAMTLTFLGRHDEAIEAIQQARELDPFSPIINTNLGRLLFHARRYDESIAQQTATIDAHPEFVVAHYRLGLAYEAARQYDAAQRAFEIAQRLSGGAPAPTAALASVLAATGHEAEARRLLESLVAAAAQEYVAAPCVADVYLSLGELDRAFEWFARGVTERSSMLVTLAVNPRYDEIRHDHRFRNLVEDVGLWSA